MGAPSTKNPATPTITTTSTNMWTRVNLSQRRPTYGWLTQGRTLVNSCLIWLCEVISMQLCSRQLASQSGNLEELLSLSIGSEPNRGLHGKRPSMESLTWFTALRHYLKMVSGLSSKRLRCKEPHTRNNHSARNRKCSRCAKTSSNSFHSPFSSSYQAVSYSYQLGC